MIPEMPSNLSLYYSEYMKKGCQKPDVKWGTQRPLKENCIPVTMDGHPCTNIWNNNTKRKIIVNK